MKNIESTIQTIYDRNDRITFPEINKFRNVIEIINIRRVYEILQIFLKTENIKPYPKIIKENDFNDNWVFGVYNYYDNQLNNLVKELGASLENVDNYFKDEKFKDFKYDKDILNIKRLFYIVIQFIKENFKNKEEIKKFAKFKEIEQIELSIFLFEEEYPRRIIKRITNILINLIKKLQNKQLRNIVNIITDNN